MVTWKFLDLLRFFGSQKKQLIRPEILKITLLPETIFLQHHRKKKNNNVMRLVLRFSNDATTPPSHRLINQ
jgi:hypothetical protein